MELRELKTKKETNKQKTTKKQKQNLNRVAEESPLQFLNINLQRCSILY